MTAPKPRRRTIRFAIVAVVCLLLGAVTTGGFLVILVKSQGAVESDPLWWQGAAHTVTEGDAAATKWPVSLPGRWPAPRRVDRWESWGTAIVRPVSFYHDNACTMQAVLHGWPLPALLRVTDVRPAQGKAIHPTGDWVPLWRGIAASSAVFALGWAVLASTLPVWRLVLRRFRVSRGMCGSCGYDLNASTNRPCPECGA